MILTWLLINFVVGLVSMLVAIKLGEKDKVEVDVASMLLILAMAAFPLAGFVFLLTYLWEYAKESKFLSKVLFRL